MELQFDYSIRVVRVDVHFVHAIAYSEGVGHLADDLGSDGLLNFLSELLFFDSILKGFFEVIRGKDVL